MLKKIKNLIILIGVVCILSYLQLSIVANETAQHFFKHLSSIEKINNMVSNNSYTDDQILEFYKNSKTIMNRFSINTNLKDAHKILEEFAQLKSNGNIDLYYSVLISEANASKSLSLFINIHLIIISICIGSLILHYFFWAWPKKEKKQTST